MRHNHLFASSVLALGLCVMWACAPAQAQPDINNAPKAENPPNWNWNPGGPPRNPAGMLDLRRYIPLAPLGEQRTEVMTLAIKQRLTGAGFTDEALQTAIVGEFKTQEAARTALRDKWQKITQAVGANATPEAEMTAMLKEFREAVAQEKSRRQVAAATLEAQFKISQKPALDALLMTLGITGNEAELVGQTTGNWLTRFTPLAGIAGMANGGAIANVMPRLFTLPQIPKGANDAPLEEREQVIIPIPQPELPQLHLFEGHDNAMPNAAPPAGAPLPKFF